MFGRFGELIKFTKLSSTNLLWDHKTINFLETFIHQNVWEPDSPSFGHLQYFLFYKLVCS